MIKGYVIKMDPKKITQGKLLGGSSKGIPWQLGVQTSRNKDMPGVLIMANNNASS